MADQKLDILCFGAHPDDVELSCSGTIARHIKQGKKVGIIDLTQGELGTRGSGELRLKEAAKAAEILGVSVRHNLGMPDGFFYNSKEYQLKIIEQIRAYRPEIVITNAIHDRHPDHGKGSDLTSDACFYSGLRRIETTWNGKAQEAWRPKAVYHYIQFRNIEPDFVVDISEFMDIKIASIKAYSSQFYDPNSKEPETVISTSGFLNSVSERAADLGRIIGVKYAEGFTTERFPGVSNLFDLI